MYFASFCRDTPGAAPHRRENRLAPVADLRQATAERAGLCEDAAGKMTGPLLIIDTDIDTDIRAGAVAGAANNRYAKAGLVKNVRIAAFNRVIG